MSARGNIQRKLWVVIMVIPFLILIELRFISTQWDRHEGNHSIPLLVFYFVGMILFFLSFILSKPIARYLKKETDLPRNALSVCLVHWAILISIAVNGMIAAILQREFFTYYPFFGLTVLGLMISYPRDRSLLHRNKS